MKTRYDKKVDALYIAFQNGEGKVAHTIKLKDFILVDIGKKGKVYGIEILDASHHLPLKALQKMKTKKVRAKIKK